MPDENTKNTKDTKDIKDTKELKKIIRSKKTIQESVESSVPKQTEDRVLALSLRPKSLEDLIGQDNICQTLKSQFESHRIPHFFILSGPVGCGKTTLARILSRKIHETYGIQDVSHYYKNLPIQKKIHYEIKEVNAANQTGIDDIRKLIEHMGFKPLPPSRVKVVILDEAHQLSVPAQNALITETEDVPEHVFYIFCTSTPQKIIPALQRRAFHICPKLLKDKDNIEEIVKRSAKYAEYKGDIDSFVEGIMHYEVFSPGLIIQAAEKYFSGLSVSDSLINGKNEMVGNIDMISVCRALVGGKWNVCADILKDATRSDTYGIRASVLGYLKTVLLKSSGNKSINVAKAIRSITAAEIQDESIALPSLLSGLCLACAQMNS